MFVRECSKESANCRLELNYAQQNEDVDMIPLMMEPNYKPKGWLGLIMGTRLYYNFRAYSRVCLRLCKVYL